MSDTTPNTPNDEPLERVTVEPRSSRGAVLSVRLTAGEAQTVAARAEKSGISVSEYARRVIQQSLGTPWRLMVWDGFAPLLIAPAHRTEGDVPPNATSTTSWVPS